MKLTIASELPPKHLVTWELPDGTTAVKECTAAEYIELGRKNPTYPAKPDAQDWHFKQAAGGVAQVSTPSGTFEPLTCVDLARSGQLVICDETGRKHVLSKMIHSYSIGPNGGWTLDPQPAAFTLIDGELAKV